MGLRLTVRAGGLALAAALLAAGATLAWRLMRPAGTPGDSSARAAVQGATVRPPSGTKLTIGRGPSIALSPDGRRLVYVATAADTTQLYLRELDRGDSAPVAGTNGASDPFFSPDGRWLGFIVDQKLKKVPVGGGAAVTLADVPAARGMTWADDDRIVLAPRDNTSLWRVSAQGGKLEQMTSLADGDPSHRWPQVLPGGKGVVYTIWGGGGGWEKARVAVQPLNGGDRKVLATGAGFGRFVGDETVGYLLYAREDGLMAVPFDLSRLATVGTPSLVVDGIITNFSGGAQFAVSSTGSLAYVPDSGDDANRELVWVDRNGAAAPAATLRGMGRMFDVSPDSARIVRYNADVQAQEVVIEELASGATTRVAVHADSAPVLRTSTERHVALWSAAGTHIVYSAGSPATNLYLTAVENRGQPERLTTSRNAQWPTSWSRDGRTLAFVEADPLSGSDVWLLTLDAARKPANVRPLMRTPFNEAAPAISPDGRWIAYQSNESGRYEIYVQSLPEGGRRWQISTNSGVYPHWSPRGDEVFFRSGPTRGGMSAVPVTTQPEFTAGPARDLFDARGYDSPFNVSSDGRFLIMRLRAPDAAMQVTVVDWLAQQRPPPSPPAR
jgi:Tol biopolymer transport system component